MNPTDIAKLAFDALPRVNEIWVDDKGNFHLHPNNGGVCIQRNAPVVSNTDNEETEKRKSKKTKKGGL